MYIEEQLDKIIDILYELKGYFKADQDLKITPEEDNKKN